MGMLSSKRAIRKVVISISSKAVRWKSQRLESESRPCALGVEDILERWPCCAMNRVVLQWWPYQRRYAACHWVEFTSKVMCLKVSDRFWSSNFEIIFSHLHSEKISIVHAFALFIRRRCEESCACHRSYMLAH